MAELDLAALKRRVEFAPDSQRFRRDILAALELIPGLERERDLWRARAEGAGSLYETAALERDAMQRRAEAAETDWQRAEGRAQRLEAATRGLIDCHEYLAEKANANHESCPKVQTARAALTDSSSEETRRG